MNFLLIIVIVLIIYCLFFSEDKKCHKIENNVEDFSNLLPTIGTIPSPNSSDDENLRNSFNKVLQESLPYFEQDTSNKSLEKMFSTTSQDIIKNNVNSAN